MTPIRHAQAGDLAGLLQLNETCPEAAHWNSAIWAEVLRSSEGEPVRRCVFVLPEGDCLVACAVLQVVEDVGEIENMAVDPMRRRTGVGRELCSHLFRWAAERGARRVRLEVRAGNAGARTFYTNLGFAIEGKRPNYYIQLREDAVLMAFSLRTPEFCR